VRISIQSDIASVSRRLTDIQTKHIPRATGIALTRTAGLVQQAEVAEIRRVFDRPVPLTLKSVFIRSFNRGTLDVRVFLREEIFKGTPPAAYLLPQIVGGQRPLKRFEKALQSIRALPPGEMAVPGPGAKLNAYGNISQGLIVQILSALRATSDPGQHRIVGQGRTVRAKQKRNRKEYVVLRGRGSGSVGAKNVGIYRKDGAKLVNVIRFIRPPTYRQRLDFSGVVRRVVRQRAGAEFRAAIDDSLAKSKGKP
jgi:hypothetical protein